MIDRTSYKAPIIYASVMSSIYFLIGYVVLSYGHPHEDAFILYNYVENIVQGNGSVYSHVGERAEGATDFLWLMLLSGLCFVGLDVAIASLLASAIGAGLTGFIFFKAIHVENGMKISKTYLLLFSSIMILFLSPAMAGYAGFSSMLYSSLILLIFYIFINKNHRFYHFIPILSIIVGLFRPDGVIIGVSFTLLGFFGMRNAIRRKYLKNMLLAALVGVLYFLLRYWYFGHLLPLPLYVKMHGDGMFNGFFMNVYWVMKHIWIIILILISLLYLNRTSYQSNRIILGFIPLIMLLTSLTFATQSQNDFFRFQAPCLLVIVFIFVLALRNFAVSNFIKKIVVILLVTIVLSKYGGGTMYTFVQEKVIVNPTYIDLYPYNIKEYVDEETKIALTEAGRMAYWLDAKIIDLVGLNTVFTAKHIPDYDYIKNFGPDILMFHRSDILNANKLVEDVAEDSHGSNVLEITDMNLKAYMPSEYIEVMDYDRNIEYKETKLINTKVAPIKAVEFLIKTNTNYRIFLVKYESNYDHIYAVDTSYRYVNEIIDELYDVSEMKKFPSYLELKGFGL